MLVPTMLKGLAQDHYYNSQLSIRSFGDACTNIRSFFEVPTYHRRNLDEWNNTDLASITAKDENYKKPIYENVQLLINKLRQLQYCLSPALRTDEFLHNKIVTACQGSPACRYAVSDPPTAIGALINKLQSSITTYEKEQALTGNTAAFFTDRRYHRNTPNNRTHFRSRYMGTRNSNGTSKKTVESASFARKLTVDHGNTPSRSKTTRKLVSKLKQLANSIKLASSIQTHATLTGASMNDSSSTLASTRATTIMLTATTNWIGLWNH